MTEHSINTILEYSEPPFPNEVKTWFKHVQKHGKSNNKKHKLLVQHMHMPLLTYIRKLRIFVEYGAREGTRSKSVLTKALQTADHAVQIHNYARSLVHLEPLDAVINKECGCSTSVCNVSTSTILDVIRHPDVPAKTLYEQGIRKLKEVDCKELGKKSVRLSTCIRDGCNTDTLTALLKQQAKYESIQSQLNALKTLKKRCD